MRHKSIVIGRERRHNRPPQMSAYSELLAFNLFVAKIIDEQED
jgi:hypothetical protein